MEPSRHYWIYSPGEQANRWGEFREAGLLALSYNEGAPNDLRSYETEEDLIKSFQKVAGDTASHKNAVKALIDLRDVMKPGDLVFAKKGQKTIVGVGRVTGEYEFAADATDMQHRRRVVWFDVEERSIKDNAPQKTLTDITPYADFLVRLADTCDIEDLYTESQYRMWDETLKKWPIDALRKMSIHQYTKLGSKNSFCYYFETTISQMGGISGGGRYVFGIFDPDPTNLKPLKPGAAGDDKYRWYAKYGDTAEVAFETVRSRIVQIAEYASQANYGAIDGIDFSPAIKWKIAFIYQKRDSMGVVDIYKREMMQQAVGVEDSNVPMSQLYAKAFSMMSSPEDVFAWARRSWRKIGGVKDAEIVSSTDPENTKMVEQVDKNPRTVDWIGDFRGWFKAYGPQQGYGKYIPALEDPHSVIKFRKDNPSQGHKQAADLDLNKFPPKGQSCLSLYKRDDVKALFDETKSFRVGDDGALHTALGYYALWLRIVAFENWKDEAFWEGDDTAPGGKSRKATLLSNGFDYDEIYANRKATYKMDKYLAAIRTKPFVLLAGISGTGKSRLVRQLARGCCPEWADSTKTQKHALYDADKPGNFEMIPVRPNWHDSSELMGYVTRAVKTNEPPKYLITAFVEFLAKAWVYRDVPFFLCLDEMNLAPVEQYFAEYLSVIETRKRRPVKLGETEEELITTDPIVRWENLEKETFANAVKDLFDGKDWANAALHGRVEDVKALIVSDKGICIPPNLVVMGTVNMDETTCSFSRKVLDRAMSFELNDVSDMYDPAKLAGEGDLGFGTILTAAATTKFLTGKEAYEVDADMGKKILDILEILNEKEVDAKNEDGTDDAGKKMSLLAKTPFKIAYRTRNEIMIYCLERCGGGSGAAGVCALPKALDEALSMKVLSRIEGDNLHVPKKWLVTLSATIDKELSSLPRYDKDACKTCREKLAEMAEQASNGYTSFWTR